MNYLTESNIAQAAFDKYGDAPFCVLKIAHVPESSSDVPKRLGYWVHPMPNNGRPLFVTESDVREFIAKKSCLEAGSDTLMPDYDIRLSGVSKGSCSPNGRTLRMCLFSPMTANPNLDSQAKSPIKSITYARLDVDCEIV